MNNETLNCYQMLKINHMLLLKHDFFFILFLCILFSKQESMASVPTAPGIYVMLNKSIMVISSSLGSGENWIISAGIFEICVSFRDIRPIRHF